MDLSHEELLSVLEYVPDTGTFYWKDANPSNTRKGLVAGHTSKIHGYTTICYKRRHYKAHRLAWFYVYKVWPSYNIDHIDHIKTNNSITNLRDVTQRVNNMNKVNTKFGGNIRTKRKGYQVYFTINYTQQSFGTFISLETAELVRDFVRSFIEECDLPPSKEEIRLILEDNYGKDLYRR